MADGWAVSVGGGKRRQQTMSLRPVAAARDPVGHASSIGSEDMKFLPPPFVALAGATLLILAGTGRAGDGVAKLASDVKLEQLRKQVDEACAIPANLSNGVCDSVFATMLEYQKMMNKEAREDRKVARESGRSASESGQQKLRQENARIVVERQEADEKRQAATVKSVPQPCGSASNPCPKPCATPPCR